MWWSAKRTLDGEKITTRGSQELGSHVNKAKGGAGAVQKQGLV